MSIDLQRALSLLDSELSKKKVNCQITICGGAALILMGVVSRETIDIDIVSKEIPIEILEAAKIVAKKLNYPLGWLNNKVSPIVERLPADWQDHLIVVYTGKAITITSISRQDLINSKLHAAIERRTVDYADLIGLKPIVSELEIASQYALNQASNENYELWVSGYIRQLKADLGLL